VIAANNILKADLGSFKGKTTCKKVSPMNLVRGYFPKEIMNRHRNVTLCIDIMFVNQIPMLVSISRNIKFGTIQDIPNRSNNHLLFGIKRIIKVYQLVGFKVDNVMMDGEFEKTDLSSFEKIY
jgi:hypothetical protein